MQWAAVALNLDYDELRSVIRDLIHAELQRHAPGRFGKLKRASIQFDQPLEETIAGFDSLDLIRCGNAVANFFNLHDAGVEDLLLTDSSVNGFTYLIDQFRAGTHPALIQAVKDFTFTTSGSTGKPAFWKHDETWLAQEVSFWAKKIATLAPSRQRLVACVPQCHLYGFIWSVLIPKTLGIPVLLLTPEQLLPSKLQSGDLVIANPAIWSAWAQMNTPWPSDVLGVSSTAPFDPLTAKILSAQSLQVIDVYGSTENAGIAWRIASQSDYELIAHYHFEFDQAEPEAPSRLIRLCPDDQYRAYPVLDRMQVCAERSFKILGRKDNVIQVNGFNVSTDWVEASLRKVSDVSNCMVRKMNANEGEYLKAFIVADQSNSQSLAAIEAALVLWTENNLPDPARPRHWRFGSDLPRNEMGKLADWAIEPAELAF